MTQAPIEVRLLTRVIEDKDFHSLEKAQITQEFFASPECIALYNYIREVYYHPGSAGFVPSKQLIMERFPNMYLAPSADPVPVLAHELRKEKIRIEILSLAQDIMIEADKNPLAAKARLLAESSKISALAEVGEDLSMSSAYQSLLQNYNTVQNSGGILGIPYPWLPVNEETQGKLPGQFIVIYGRPKSMKSFVAIYMACHDYLSSRRRVMFYTREMHPMLVAQRMAACIAGVDYKAFKNGQLQPELKAQTFNILQELMEDEKNAGETGTVQPALKIVSDRGAGGSGGGVSWLRSKIKEFKPHIVYVDGMYLMRDDRTNQRTVDWKAIAHISQDLKLTAQEFEVPLIGVTQANRGSQKSAGEDLTELAFSDSLGQDADAVFRVSKKERIDDHKIKQSEIWITAPGLREGKFEGIVVGGNPCTDFSFKRLLTGMEKDDDAAQQSNQKQRSNQPSVSPNYKNSFVQDIRPPLKK